MAEVENVESAIADAGRRARAAARLSATASRLVPQTFAVVNTAVATFRALATNLLQAVVTLLLLFIVHQLFVWIDQEPEVAFDRAALLFETAEITYDASGVFYNAAADVLNAGVIPLWNAGAFYVVEPLIALSLEVFMQAFFKKHYTGVWTEETMPYNGLDCLASAQAAQWCGRYAAYAEMLESEEKRGGFVDGSTVYRSASRRVLFDQPSALENRSYVFGVATGRRLSARANDAVFPFFDTEELTGVVSDFGTLFVVLGAPLSDIAFGSVGELISESFGFLADVVFAVLKAFMGVLKMLMKSGMLTTLMTLGVDFLVVGMTEIALPMLFAAIDLLFCVIDFFTPSTWHEQLECVDKKCFKGLNLVTDLLVFWHMPIVLHRFTAVMEATLNSRTAKSFVPHTTPDTFATSGRVVDPDTGEPIEIDATESASMPNPMYEFDFADKFKEFLPTTAGDQCASCFVCKARRVVENDARLLRRGSRGTASFSGQCSPFASGGRRSQMRDSPFASGLVKPRTEVLAFGVGAPAGSSDVLAFCVGSGPSSDWFGWWWPPSATCSRSRPTQDLQAT